MPLRASIQVPFHKLNWLLAREEEDQLIMYCKQMFGCFQYGVRSLLGLFSVISLSRFYLVCLRMFNTNSARRKRERCAKQLLWRVALELEKVHYLLWSPKLEQVFICAFAARIFTLNLLGNWASSDVESKTYIFHLNCVTFLGVIVGFGTSSGYFGNSFLFTGF